VKPFTDPAVAARFACYPPEVRKRMLALRALIFHVAASTDGVGELQETLKWGEPAYVTAETKTGSTVRMDWKAKRPDTYSVYFNCNTGLIDRFTNMFPTEFRFEGNRAIVFTLKDRLAKDALAVCIAASLTYHATKRMRTAFGNAPNAA
jgi:Domain of unknown function (DU1801)